MGKKHRSRKKLGNRDSSPIRTRVPVTTEPLMQVSQDDPSVHHDDISPTEIEAAIPGFVKKLGTD
jgi:hypothetical protein